MTTTFQYDAVGQRFKKQIGNQVTISLWEKGKIIEDIKTTGSMISKDMYVQGLFTEGVVKPETNEYGYQEYGDFYINSFDTNNDVITTWLINTDTNPSNYSYDAYGNKSGSSDNLPSPYGYNGYYRDSETGLYYLNARYYDPTTQQFTQEDTYWGDGTDLYAYCHFNPVICL
jgi:RHS repeat-associated protein